MWFRATLIGTSFLSASAQLLVQFRTPKMNDKLLAGESIEDSKPVSFFYVDHYGSPGGSLETIVEEHFFKNPCLLMEPAYSLVRDQMTFYGTCNYQEMIRLKLERSSGEWTATMMQTEFSCRNDVVRHFVLARQGTNHTVNSNISLDFKLGDVIIHLLLHKQGLNRKEVRCMYPVLNYSSRRLAVDKYCQCLSGTKFDFRKTWFELCPEKSSFWKNGRMYIQILIFSAIFAIAVLVFLKKKKSNKINAVPQTTSQLADNLPL